MGELGSITYFTKLALLRLAGTVMGEVSAHNIFHGSSITAIGWHGYGRGRIPSHISRSQHYCGWLARYCERSGPITYLPEPPLLRLADKVIGEIGSYTIFYGASIIVVGWQDYERGRVLVISRSQHY